MKKINIKGFTLAEVLITLGIIGVVAAITIPTVIQKHQSKVYTTQLKKAYTELNQAFAILAREENCIGNLSCVGYFTSANSSGYWSMAMDGLSKYIKLAKNCGITNGNCFNSNYADLNGTNHDGVTSGARALTASGYAFKIYDYFSGNCSDTYSIGENGGICARIDVDVNGPKPPNIRGRDYFSFWLTNSGILYPYGGHLQPSSLASPWDQNTTSKSCFATEHTSYGWGCAGRIMENGWEMDY